MRNPTEKELRDIYKGVSFASPFDRAPLSEEAVLYDFESARGNTFCLSSGPDAPAELKAVSEKTEEIDNAVRLLKA